MLSASCELIRPLFQLGEGVSKAVTVLEYLPRQQIAVQFSEDLKAGQSCVLTLEYSANLSHSYDGFYNSSYTDKDGNKRYTCSLCTHFKTAGRCSAEDLIKSLIIRPYDRYS